MISWRLRSPIICDDAVDAKIASTDEIDLLMRAAELHLDRVTTLSNRAWNADVLFWTVILLSGSALISYALKPDGLLSEVILDQSWLVITGYYCSVFVYFFLMMGNKHQSLVTERNRYQLCQDRAFRAAGFNDLQMFAAAEQPVTFAKIKRRRILASAVWGAKLLSTLIMITGIFAISQISADYANASRIDAENRKSAIAALVSDAPQNELQRLRAAKNTAILQAQSFKPEKNKIHCAFLDCSCSCLAPKLGTVIWAAGLLLFGLFGILAFFRI